MNKINYDPEDSIIRFDAIAEFLEDQNLGSRITSRFQGMNDQLFSLLKNK